MAFKEIQGNLHVSENLIIGPFGSNTPLIVTDTFNDIDLNTILEGTICYVKEKYSFYIFEDGELKVYSPLQHSNIQFIDFDDLTPVTEESDCNEFYKYLNEEEYKDLINNDFLVWYLNDGTRINLKTKYVLLSKTKETSSDSKLRRSTTVFTSGILYNPESDLNNLTEDKISITKYTESDPETGEEILKFKLVLIINNIVNLKTNKFFDKEVSGEGVDQQIEEGQIAYCPSGSMVVDSEEQTSTGWYLVEDLSELEVGDKIIIASSTEDYALGTESNSSKSNRKGASITRSGNKLTTITPTVQRIELVSKYVPEEVVSEESEEPSQDVSESEETQQNDSVVFALRTYDHPESWGNGYLYASSSSSNELKTKLVLDSEDANWLFDLQENSIIKLTAQGENTRNVLGYNPNNTSPIFSAYAEDSSTRKPLSIYKFIEGQGEIIYFEKTFLKKQNGEIIEIKPTVETLYINKFDNKIYEFRNDNLIEISKVLELGISSTTAYAGNLGNQNRTDINRILNNNTTFNGDKTFNNDITAANLKTDGCLEITEHTLEEPILKANTDDGVKDVISWAEREHQGEHFSLDNIGRIDSYNLNLNLNRAFIEKDEDDSYLPFLTVLNEEGEEIEYGQDPASIKLENIADPTGDTEAVNKKYVDNITDLKADKVGPLPSYTAASSTNVSEFISTYNISQKDTVCIKYAGGGHSFLGRLHYESGPNILIFELEEFGSNRRYVGSAASGNSISFGDIIDTTTYRQDYELEENKVTSITNQSTDTQYPSAKCVYDKIEEVREVAEGKTKTIIVSCENPTLPTTDNKAREYKKDDGTYFTSLNDFNTYINGFTLKNDKFNSSVDIIPFNNYEYFISTDKVVYIPKDLGGIVVSPIMVSFKYGDEILVVEQNIPDRWVGPNFFLYASDSKTDLSNYYTKQESDEKFVSLNNNDNIHGIKSFSDGSIVIGNTVLTEFQLIKLLELLDNIESDKTQEPPLPINCVGTYNFMFGDVVYSSLKLNSDFTGTYTYGSETIDLNYYFDEGNSKIILFKSSGSVSRYNIFINSNQAISTGLIINSNEVHTVKLMVQGSTQINEQSFVRG